MKLLFERQFLVLTVKFLNQIVTGNAANCDIHTDKMQKRVEYRKKSIFTGSIKRNIYFIQCVKTFLC